MPSPKPHALYHVGLKILLKKGEYFLFLNEADTNRLDLPGGRMDDTEHYVPLTDILAREVREELGENLKYTLGKPILQFRRHVESIGLHVFITVYEAAYISGDITLSFEHSNHQWIHKDAFSFTEKDFFNAEEYTAFKSYFDSIATK